VLELYAMHSCPYCAELREQLRWDGEEFVEYDVESDPAARERLGRVAPELTVVPILVRDGVVAGVGWQGRGCQLTPK
jgi:glutaredoxin